MNEVASIHIVDDDPSVCRALERLFCSVGLKAASHATPEEFLELEKVENPGCLLLDIRMPGANGLDFQDRLRVAQVGLPVVIMSGFGDIAMSVRAMKAGAVDFLTKPFREQDVLDAVDRAIELSRQRQAALQADQHVRQLYARLTPREQQTMRLVTAGKLNKQIAHLMGLSEVTVKLHRKAVMQKTGARSVAELVRMADALQLNRPDEDGVLSLDAHRPAAGGAAPATARPLAAQAMPSSIAS